jgi:hypothetical protein
MDYSRFHPRVLAGSPFSEFEEAYESRAAHALIPNARKQSVGTHAIPDQITIFDKQAFSSRIAAERLKEVPNGLAERTWPV